MSSKNRIECIVVIIAKENKNAKVYFQFDGINKNGQSYLRKLETVISVPSTYSLTIGCDKTVDNIDSLE